MNQNIKSIRHAVEAFKIFFEDRTGRPSSSMIYPSKLIYFFLKMYRNKVSYEDRYIKARSNEDLNVELTIPCVSLEEVDQVECPCAPASGCSFFKSTHPLPRMLNGMPNSVTLIKKDGKQKNYGAFTYVDWYNFEDKINGRVRAQATQPYFTMKNINSQRHLYVYANVEEYSSLQAVAVAGNFSDPLEVASFPVCGKELKELCSPMDEEFVIEEEIQSKVFELTYAALSGFKNASTGIDLLNNNNNDTVGQNAG